MLLALPVIALMWVSSYSRDEPRLGGFPFFIWYQFLWVFLTSALTYTAYRIVLVARPHRPMDDLATADGSGAAGRHRGGAGMSNINGVALAVLVVLFALVTGMGFWASRWRRPTSMESLDEWGLGGRSFGTWITWFLLGGDLYTAYTFIAVPAAMFAAGSVSGFFAVPYTIVLYPIIFVFMGRMWSVSHRHGYVTTADFVRGRFGSRGLSLAVAVTGFLATMPYIALQLVGIQAVLEVVGLGGGDSIIAKDLPLFIAFALLAAYTYSSGLRAPAVIAFVKDTLIYLVIIVAIIYLPTKFGGWTHIFDAAQSQDGGARTRSTASPTASSSPEGRSTGPTPPSAWARRSRCSCTRTRSPRACRPPRATRCGATRPSCRPTASCSACSRCSAGSRSRPAPSRSAPTASPTRSSSSRSCSRTRSRRGSRAWPSRRSPSGRSCRRRSCRSRRPTPSPATSTRSGSSPTRRSQQEAKVSKLASLVVKLFALVFVLLLDKQNAINFQLLGGIWILQTFPTIVLGLYTRWMHRWALLAGWAVGMVYGTWQAWNVANPRAGVDHFGGSLAQMPVIGQLGYIALTAFVINLVVAVVLTARAAGWSRRPTVRTRPSAATTSRMPVTPGCRRCSSRSTRRRRASDPRRMPCRRHRGPARHTLAACASR